MTAEQKDFPESEWDKTMGDAKVNFDELKTLFGKTEGILKRLKSLYGEEETNLLEKTKPGTKALADEGGKDNFKKHNKALTKLVSDYEVELKRIQDELTGCKRSSSRHFAFIYSYHQSQTMKMVFRELEKELQSEFRLKKMSNVMFEELKSVDDMIHGSPLVALCMNASRLKTDAINAVKGVKELENTVLVVFHHMEQSAPRFPQSRQTLNGQQFDSLAGIFDITFHKEKGLYSCDMSCKAISEIAAFLEKYLKRRPTHS